MPKWWVGAALLLPLLLAGCTGDGAGEKATDANDTGPDAPDLPATLPWGFQGCDAVVFFAEVPAQAVRPHLPEGFRPVPVAAGMTGTSANPTDGGSFGVEVFTCRQGVGLNETVNDTVYASYFAFAEPPAALRDATVDMHFVKWDVVVQDAARREILASIGVPVRTGTATWSAFSTATPMGVSAATLEMDGTHRFQARSVAPGPTSGSFIEYTAVPDGLIAWKTRFALSASALGPGSVTVPAGTLAAEILGGTSADGSVMTFRGDFLDGEIDLRVSSR